MAKSPDFLQQSFVKKTKENDLQDIGEDNLSALELYLHDLGHERRPESRKNVILDSLSNNIQPSTSYTPKNDGRKKQEKEQNHPRTKKSFQRCCSSFMIGIVIVVSLASLFINVLMIKGTIVPSGCQRIENRKAIGTISNIVLRRS
ncbi:uncharacterized protein LOC116290908 [Actinia tenebrosa]|uniref:Uncharacterized protein LOC116290908 n=1 Tax=Actinia tenebrosa TaxID=6105 RepID=A0A6P8HML3_ACTTE|nr:uncharacterized protein LOC116290908 [Actinia tenebrosa]